MNPSIDTLAGFLLTLALHASVLLGAVWLAERRGWLRQPAWLALAWRGALFGALLSAATEAVEWPAARPATTAAAVAEAGVADRSALPALHEPGPAAVAASTDPRPLPALAAATPRAVAITRTRPAPGLPLPDLATLALLALWLSAIVLGSLRLAGQAIGVWRLDRAASRRDAAPDRRLQAQARDLAAALGIATPVLSLSPSVRSPMVLPGGRVLLPAWVPALDDAQVRALLAHELAHLQRRDPLWRLAERIALVPLCFHPLAWTAVRRLDALAEDACDARAAELLGSGRPLAECLAACLSHAAPRPRTPALAVAMAAEPGPVVRRVKNLLENAPMSPRPIPPALRRTALVLGLAAVIALPGLAVTSFATDAMAEGLFHINSEGRDSIRYTRRDNGGSQQVALVGKVTFTDAEDDVLTLGPDSELDLRETRDGVTRRYDASLVDGQIQRRYRVDGKDQPIDADGRAWLARILPEVIRESAIHVEARGKRFLAQGGPTALMAEIAKIESDFATRRYLGVLFANATLDEAQAEQAIALVGSIGSDFEMRQALQGALEQQALSPARQAQLLVAARAIGSDFELAELLVTFAGKATMDGEVVPAWRETLDGIGSDFEQRRALEAVLDRRDAPSAAIAMALEAATGIGSDFEARQVLAKAAPRVHGDAVVLPAWMALADTVGSDFEQREALVALAETGPLDLATAEAYLRSVDAIGSDFESGQALQALAHAMPADAALIERYRAAARRLGDFERGQAEQALDRFAVVD